MPGTGGAGASGVCNSKAGVLLANTSSAVPQAGAGAGAGAGASPIGATRADRFFLQTKPNRQARRIAKKTAPAAPTKTKAAPSEPELREPRVGCAVVGAGERLGTGVGFDEG